MLKISLLVLVISGILAVIRWFNQDIDTMGFAPLAGTSKRHLPFPTGRYIVGSSDLMTKNSSIFMRCFYPVAEGQDHANEKYSSLWPKWLPALEYSDGYLRFKMSRRVPLLPRVFRWLIHDPYVPNVFSGDVVKTDSSLLPVVVFSHGMGAMRTTYSTLLTDLASHGYFVAAVEHKDGSAAATVDSDGTWTNERKLLPEEDEYTVRNGQVNQRVAECEAAYKLLEDLNGGRGQEWASAFAPTESFLSSLVSQLDINNCHIAGHSFGGATAVKALYTSR